MEEIKKCPFCSMVLDEKSILYKGYYVCTSCASTIDHSKNADIIRRYGNYIKNLEFEGANLLKKVILDEKSLDINELQLFTFYTSMLDLFVTSDATQIIKFLSDSTKTHVDAVIEVVNFLSSVSIYIDKLGDYILNYVNMQEKYLSNVNHHDVEIAFIEVKKRYFKSIQNKSKFILETYHMNKLNLNEITELIRTQDPSNIAALYSIFDEVTIDVYTANEINHYLLTCDHSLELYYKKNRKITQNFKEYYKKSRLLRKKLHLSVNNRYKWQRRINRPNHLLRDFLLLIGLIILIIYGMYTI